MVGTGEVRPTPIGRFLTDEPIPHPNKRCCPNWTAEEMEERG